IITVVVVAEHIGWVHCSSLDREKKLLFRMEVTLSVQTSTTGNFNITILPIYLYTSGFFLLTTWAGILGVPIRCFISYMFDVRNTENIKASYGLILNIITQIC
ncbi:hypothetical protein ACJX0J_023714, partial [Zea mays]